MSEATVDPSATPASWAIRAADRSPSVQRSHARSVLRAQQIVQAARRLAAVRGSTFTTHELVKEAGVALQTFYKHFESKDQVLLAVIEDMILESCLDLRQRGKLIDDPIDRLRLYVTGAVQTDRGGSMAAAGAQFVTTEHWRLQQLYPEQLALATRPFADLLLEALEAAKDAGSLHPANPQYDAWLATQLIMAVFHHYAFAASDDSVDDIADRLWAFCLAGFGGGAPSAARRPSSN
jgi:TetR/AcrR family transcriptional regulator